MNVEDAIYQINNDAASYLKRDVGGKGYVCPICGDGDGTNGRNGITTKDGIHFTCWHGCFASADVIDIIGMEYGLSDFKEKLHKAAEIFHIDLDGASDPARPAVRATPVQRQQKATPAAPAEETDYTAFFLKAQKDLTKTDYHLKRGISAETAGRFGLGYVEDWKHPKAPAGVRYTSRLIIPTSKYSYLARDVRSDVPAAEKDYTKSKVGAVHLFNEDALYNSEEPVFVVEGEIDALSIIEAGHAAVAVGSTACVGVLLRAVKKRKPTQPLVLLLDDDKAGKVAQEKLAKELSSIGCTFFAGKLEGAKDANELLVKDRASLEKQLAGLIADTLAAQAAAPVPDLADPAEYDEYEAAPAEYDDETAPAEPSELTEEEKAAKEREAYLRGSAANKIDAFFDSVIAGIDKEGIKTGFPKIDQAIDGGLYSGLYVVGAISSVGKTTFCLQIADNIAAAGTDVIIFSLEMSTNELMAKSISRETCFVSLKDYGNFSLYGRTTRGIMNGNKWKGYKEKDRSVITKAKEKYASYANHIYIKEGIGDIGVSQIRESIEAHIRITGSKPVVFIDYLQIIAPADVRATDKQNMDKAVLELKRISRDFDIPVIVISSFNRESYTEPVNLSSFKESGAIEYSSDVLIGLQYEGMDYEGGEDQKKRKARILDLISDMTKEAKEGRAQPIQVKILKNRNGSKDSSIVLKFYPMFNVFES